ncbi:MAG: O-antigen ligase [Rhizobiaceae bacterium]
MATGIAMILLAILLISFEPFAATDLAVEPALGPNPVNQIGFSLAGMLAVFAMLTFADRRRTLALADIAWLPVVACLMFSASNAPDPAGATRSVLFTLIVVVICAGVLALPHSPAALRRVFTAVVLAVLALSYFGILFLPDAAIHGAGGNEAQHEGLWRGVFSHKNVAGPVMATFLFYGIYLMRCGGRWAGVAIIVLAGIFVIQTGSKTTNGMIPLAIGAAFAGRVFASRWLPVLLIVVSVASAATFTIGTAVSPWAAGIVEATMDDPTYTGRVTLWAVGLENIAARPWTGYGFDGFWLSPVVTDSFLPIDADWDYREIVNGHSNYIDMALFMGIPAAAIVVFVLCVRPLADFLRCRPGRDNRRLADFFLMVLTFVLLNSMLESSWFRRADPTWVMMIFAVLGLRLTARLNLR